MRRILITTLAAGLVLAACADDEPETTDDEVTDTDTTNDEPDEPDDPDEDLDDPDTDDGDEPDDGDEAEDPDDGDEAEDAEEPDDEAAGEGDDFPVTVTDSRGTDVELDDAPERIVSLSATHTEILFAVGADDQVIAVDDQSDFPDEAPQTDLSGFEPNLEAIAAEDPDLVIAASDPGELASGLEELGIDVLLLDAATDLADAYDQWELVGEATGHADTAEELVEDAQATIDELVEDAPDEGFSYYHELDENLFTATSATFIGDVYGRFGLENVADEADEEGSGFPQLSEEYLVDADPELIFLAAAGLGQDAETVAERPGWDTLTAVQEDNLVEVSPSLSSRWGPRVTEFAELVRDAIEDAA